MSARADSWQARYLERWYRRRLDWVGGTAQFHNMIAKYLSSDKEVLELGPGPANRTSAFLRSKCAAVDGLDIDEEAKQNADLRQVYVYDGAQWPIQEHQYDVVVADYVFEHLASPLTTAVEAHRVLRPGGMFFFRTPNLWHYTALVSWLSPHWVHRLLANRLRNLPPEAHEPYPTFYRINRRRAIQSIFSKAGFEEVELLSIEKEPSYGMSSRTLFLVFMLYERVVNSTSLFAPFRANWLGAFRKGGADG